MYLTQIIFMLGVLMNALLPSVFAMLAVWLLTRAHRPRLALVVGLVLNTAILVAAYLALFNFDLAPALNCFYGCGDLAGTSVFQLELGLNLGSILVAVMALGIKPAR